eukprot:GHVR01135916.1.p2 GENE.GHVR01135916.1~~GHVR01135916.1.p2  ORF type:complete len:104 (+),score=8.06 GHVR01135916.1:447-758(+)
MRRPMQAPTPSDSPSTRVAALSPTCTQVTLALTPSRPLPLRSYNAPRALTSRFEKPGARLLVTWSRIFRLSVGICWMWNQLVQAPSPTSSALSVKQLITGTLQ